MQKKVEENTVPQRMEPGRSHGELAHGEVTEPSWKNTLELTHQQMYLVDPQGVCPPAEGRPGRPQADSVFFPLITSAEPEPRGPEVQLSFSVPPSCFITHSTTTRPLKRRF